MAKKHKQRNMKVMKRHYDAPKVQWMQLMTLNLLQAASIETGELYGDGEDYIQE